jgi:hypothetical protein
MKRSVEAGNPNNWSNLLDNVAHAFHNPELVSPEKVNVHVDPLLERGNLWIEATHVQESLHITQPQNSCKSLAEHRYS